MTDAPPIITNEDAAIDSAFFGSHAGRTCYARAHHSGWEWHRADLKRHARCSKPPGLICTTGLRFENLPASTADRGGAAGGPIGKLAQCAAGWVDASKHTAPRPRRMEPWLQPSLVPPRKLVQTTGTV